MSDTRKTLAEIMDEITTVLDCAPGDDIRRVDEAHLRAWIIGLVEQAHAAGVRAATPKPERTL